MSLRLAINGFGRMGRLAFRRGFDLPGLEIVHVNDPQGTAGAAAHLLEHDSVHGRWNRRVDVAGDRAFEVEGQRVSWSSHGDVGDLPWGELEVDLALECSGQLKTRERLEPYLRAGVRKVVVSTPVKEEALNIVMGINDHLYDPGRHHIVTAASCTTNALAPVVKAVDDGLGIEHGAVTTLHSVTNTQRVVDRFHPDLRRARSSALSLIPTSTGSATAIIGIFPQLEGRLTSMAVRVPTQNTSIIDCCFELERRSTAAEVNEVLERAAEGELSGYLGYETRPLVSIDFVNDPRNSVIDARSTTVSGGKLAKIIAWYDSEWGYVCRMIDLVRKVAAGLETP